MGGGNKFIEQCFIASHDDSSTDCFIIKLFHRELRLAFLLNKLHETFRNKLPQTVAAKWLECKQESGLRHTPVIHA